MSGLPREPGGEKMQEIELIPKECKNGSLTLKLIKREKDIALYSVHNVAGIIHAYEIHRIRLQRGNESMIKGQRVVFKTKEKLASNEDFGTWALCSESEKRALEIFESWVAQSTWHSWSES
jgi:hypothetical protein